MVTTTDIRHLLGDPDVTLLSDETVAAILSYETNAYRAAAAAARSIAGKVAKKVDLNAKGVSIKASQSYDHWLNLSKALDQRAKEGGGSGTSGSTGIAAPVFTGVSISEMQEVRNTPDRVPSYFVDGQFENDPVKQSELVE